MTTQVDDDYRKGYEAGYFWGRMDEMSGKPYDKRTIIERTGGSLSGIIPEPDAEFVEETKEDGN